MRLLLDTHISSGSSQEISTIENADVVFLSVAAIWEATIKYHLGKLPLPEAPHPWPAIQREQHGIESLPIDEAAVAHLSKLPPHHSDPFDRIMVCQAFRTTCRSSRLIR